jgi:hypothetical protein
MIHQPSLREIHSRASGKLSDKWDIYLDIYDHLLSGHRSKNINILEIGVQNGGSLETWGAYFDKAENIIGCDINAKCESLQFTDKRIRVIVGDATTEDTAREVDKLAQSFDIVIEDGSHTSRDIITTFARFFPKLRPGGLYVAEDLHCCYWEEWGGGLSSPYSGIEYFKALCDCLNSRHWYRSDTTQADYINKIGRHHCITISNELLDSIRSIEFYDSLCVIRKAQDGSLARIKERIIGGSEENVTSGIKQLGKCMPIYHQKGSRLTGLADFAIEADLLSEDNARLADDNARLADDNARFLRSNEALIDELFKAKTSLSWRLTSPLRSIKKSAMILIGLITNKSKG